MESRIKEVQIIPIKPRDGLVAFASLVFEDAFYLGSIGIVTRPQGGHRLAYPTRITANGSFNVFHPINRNTAEFIEQAILEKFEYVFARDIGG